MIPSWIDTAAIKAIINFFLIINEIMLGLVISMLLPAAFVFMATYFMNSGKR